MLKLIAFFFFNLRILKSLSFLINTFQLKKGEGDSVVFPYIKRRKAKNIQILIYHRVNDDKDPFFPATPIEVFKKQMYYLVSNFNICALEEAVERLKRKDVPDNTLVITFDDGYRDNYLNAFPVLKTLSIPATIFLSTEAIGTGKRLWHDRVFSAFRETQLPFLEGLNSIPGKHMLRTLEEKLSTQRKVLDFLRTLNDSDLYYWIDYLVKKLAVEDRKEAPDFMLTWADICLMHQSGIYFGSHTVTHPVLSRVSLDKLQDEIFESKKTLETKLRIPIKTFAYPFGRKTDFDDSSKNALKEAGYICGVTTIFGANGKDQDLFELRRGKPWEEDVASFALKLNWYKFIS